MIYCFVITSNGGMLQVKISGGKSVVKALRHVTIMSSGALREAFVNTVFLGGFTLHPITMRC